MRRVLGLLEWKRYKTCGGCKGKEVYIPRYQFNLLSVPMNPGNHIPEYLMVRCRDCGDYYIMESSSELSLHITNDEFNSGDVRRKLKKDMFYPHRRGELRKILRLVKNCRVKR